MERQPHSNILRFPTIGAHLIDGATPAYAPTEPPHAAEACSELLEDEPCRPPFTRVGLVLMLCTGLPLLVVIVWALVAWMPTA